MKNLLALTLLISLLSNNSMAQSQVVINKYSIAIDIDAGHSFPNFNKPQDRWKASFYPAGAITISLRGRLSNHWQTDLGLGITGYALVNKGPVDKYVLDFASPHLTTGIRYAERKGNRNEKFIGLKTGMQLGYTQSFTEEFSTYQVTISGNDPLYFFLRPEIGLRNSLNKRVNGFNLSYEFGTFFRYNLNYLGSAKFDEPANTTTITPRGNIIGMYFNIVFPAGRQKMKVILDEKRRKSNKISRPSLS